MPAKQNVTLQNQLNIPLANYANGTRSFGPAALPANCSYVGLTLNRCTSADSTIWPNATTVVTVQMDFSFDGGTTFPPEASEQFTASGGIISPKPGYELPASSAFWSFDTPPTHARATVTISGGPLRTSGALQAG